MQEGDMNYGSCSLTSRRFKSTNHLCHKTIQQKVEIIERDNSIEIKPVEYNAKSMHGMFKTDGHTVDRFMAQKIFEKELEERG